MLKKNLLIIALFLLIKNNAGAYIILDGGRAGGLKAFTGLADDAVSILYNPAGLAALDNHEIMLHSADKFGLGIQHNQLFYALPVIKNITFGFSVSTLSYGDNEINIKENNYNFALASRLYKNLFGGLNYKFFNNDISYFNMPYAEGKGGGLDFGLLYKLKNLRFGVSLLNAGDVKIKYEDGGSSVFGNQILRAGLSYIFDNLIIAADADEDKRYYCGLEYKMFNDIFTARAGAVKQYSPADKIQLSLGFRLMFSNMYIDYTNDISKPLGNTNKFSLGYKFGYKEYIHLKNENDVYTIFSHQIELLKKPANNLFILNLKNDFNENSEIEIILNNPRFFAKPTQKKIFAVRNKNIAEPLAINLNQITLNDNRQIIDDYIDLKIKYFVNNRIFEQSEKIKVRIYPANALIWDNPNKIGAFINSKSEAIIKFNQALFEQFNDELKNAAFQKNIFKTELIFAGLKSLRMHYFADIKYPYAGIFAKQKELDFINFPAQTLKNKYGDCDDLTVLFASLLLNAGIDIKIVLTETHIFLLFDSGFKARANLILPQIINNSGVIIDDKYYLPLETTALNNSFSDAVKKGKFIFDNSGNKEVIGINDIWSEYQPLNITENYNPDIPLKHNVLKIINENKITFATDINLKANDNVLLQTAKKNIEEQKHWDAFFIYEELFRRGNYKNITIINNLAGLYYLAGDFRKSIDYYLMALELERSAYYYLQVALLYYKLNDYSKAEYYYKLSVETDPLYFENEYFHKLGK